jgi:hypothetical protein
MLYIKINKDNVYEYPYTLTNLKKDFPNVSFPVDVHLTQTNLAIFNVFPVKETSKPLVDDFIKIIVEDNPELYNGEWTQKYIVIDRTLEDQKEYRDSVIALIVQDTKHHLDLFAQTRGYDSILSACTYATSNITKFASEGQYCIESRDATWTKLYSIFDEIEASTRPMIHHFTDIKSELPPLVWPT